MVGPYSEPGLWYPLLAPFSGRLCSVDSLGGRSGKGLVFRLSLLACDARLWTEPWKLLQPVWEEGRWGKTSILNLYIHFNIYKTSILSRNLFLMWSLLSTFFKAPVRGFGWKLAIWQLKRRARTWPNTTESSFKTIPALVAYKNMLQKVSNCCILSLTEVHMAGVSGTE